MAGDIKTLRVRKLESQVFGAVSAERAWTPAVNVYQCGGSLHVCVELAGVEREAVSVTVEPGRLVIEGRRLVPEPEPEGGAAQCIRVMEIDHGLFRRVLSLPGSVVLDKVHSSLRDGLLWVVLPMDG